jgi:hypothetical protein
VKLVLLGTKSYRNDHLALSLLGANRAMRSTDEVSTALPDLRTVSLAEMPDPATLDKMVQRTLPGSLATVPAAPRGAAFSSAI